jgi:hypothetical protein
VGATGAVVGLTVEGLTGAFVGVAAGSDGVVALEVPPSPTPGMTQKSVRALTLSPPSQPGTASPEPL